MDKYVTVFVGLGRLFFLNESTMLIATQYGWHGVVNSHRLPWHCDVIFTPEICGGGAAMVNVAQFHLIC